MQPSSIFKLYLKNIWRETVIFLTALILIAETRKASRSRNRERK